MPRPSQSPNVSRWLNCTPALLQRYTVPDVPPFDREYTQLSDRLSVSTDGLRSASATLNEQAGRLTDAVGAAPAGTEPSSVGAARFAASVEAFSAAYAGRVAGHGQAAQTAAYSYAKTDDGGTASITAVSV